MKTPRITKKAARIEIATINDKLAAIGAAWRERGVADGEFAARDVLCERRNLLVAIVWPSVNQVDSSVR